MKLYVVVWSRLSVGLMVAQACHALRAMVDAHPALEASWFSESNNLVVLVHDDIPTLADQLEATGFRLARFHEPDLDDRLTAICVEPAARPALRRLPLAGAAPAPAA